MNEKEETKKEIIERAKRDMAREIFEDMYDVVSIAEFFNETVTLTVKDVKEIAKRYGVIV